METKYSQKTKSSVKSSYLLIDSTHLLSNQITQEQYDRDIVSIDKWQSNSISIRNSWLPVNRPSISYWTCYSTETPLRGRSAGK